MINMMKNTKKSFTLIELLVVVAIIGILAAVGVVAYSGYTAGAKKQAAKSKIVEIQRNLQTIKIGIIDLPTFYIDFNAWRNRDPNFRSSSKDVETMLQLAHVYFVKPRFDEQAFKVLESNINNYIITHIWLYKSK